MDKTWDLARGRWREILPALGIPSTVLDGKHHACPVCGGKDRFRFSTNDPTQSGGYYCNACGSGNGINLLRKFHGWDFKRAADEIDKIIGNLPQPCREFTQTTATNPAACRRLYEASQPVQDGDPVSLYLAKRSLAGAPWPKVLRYVPEMKHGTGGRYPGMIAVFADAGGKPATIHRTFLTPSGEKAKADPVRMFMPGKLPDGGAIRLGPVAEALGIAEGIETAMAAARLHGLPVWATTSEVMLQKWQPPSEVRSVLIFADSDEGFAGQAAAFNLAKTLKRNDPKRDINVMLPPMGQDWNDVLKEQHR